MSLDETNVNSLAHRRLLHAVANLRKSQHISKPTRNEPYTDPDEFGLVKKKAPIASEAQTVKVKDIVDVLKKNDKHTKTKNLLTNVRKQKKVLERPLEKPAAERIKRRIGYEKVKTKLMRWNATVTKNRTSEAQVFPLPQAETLFVNTSAFAKPLERNIKSDLQQQLMDIDAKLKRLLNERDGVEVIDQAKEVENEEKLLQQKLTRKELLAKRKELLYLKMRQAQMQTKARLQNKVKSKKYHRLLKRQKMKEQIKEFELLKKTNPEAALEKLDAIERNRIYERASLRHKNTGTWAKNLQMRAKNDKSVRKDLAEQLQISRELTQKKKEEDEAEEDNEENFNEVEDDAQEIDPFNPWTRVKSKNNKENLKEEDDKSWRKYWMERNVQQKLVEEYEKDKKINNEKDEEEDKRNTTSINSEEEDHHENEQNFIEEEKQELKIKRKKIKNKAKSAATYEKGWLVEEIVETPDIDSIFDEGEERQRNRLQKKLKKMELKAEAFKKSEKLQKIKKNKKTKLIKNKNAEEMEKLALKNQTRKKPLLDEELNADSLNKGKSLANVDLKTTANVEEKESDIIDVNKVANVRLQKNARELEHLDNEECDLNLNETDDENEHLNINEAFEDDDIVADFTAEKEDKTKLKNTELELSMPGWGSWAGAGISAEDLAARKAKAQRRRLILTEQKKRVDAKKPHVYINEAVSKNMREHLVSDVPFPFTRVNDFEASVRVPVGRNFVPETAFRMMIRPEVRVRKGQVIEPMNEAELVKPERRLHHEVDKRIAVAQKQKAQKKLPKKF